MRPSIFQRKALHRQLSKRCMIYISLPAIPSSAPLHVPRIKSMFDGHVTTRRVFILPQTKRNQWARIRVAIPEHETEGPRAILTGELVEIIGPGKSPPPAQAPRAHATRALALWRPLKPALQSASSSPSSKRISCISVYCRAAIPLQIRGVYFLLWTNREPPPPRHGRTRTDASRKHAPTHTHPHNTQHTRTCTRTHRHIGASQ